MSKGMGRFGKLAFLAWMAPSLLGCERLVQVVNGVILSQKEFPQSSSPSPSPSPSQLACTLHVAPDGSDGNDGKSRLKALRSLQAASDASTYGDVVCAYPGDYSGFTVRPLSAFSTENQAILDGIQAASTNDAYGIGSWVSTHYPGHARTRFVSVEKGMAVIHLMTGNVRIDRNFVDLDGFEVEGSQASGFNVLVMVEGSGSRILNNHVHTLYVAQSFIDQSNGGAGIDFAGPGNYLGVEHEIAGNSVHDIWGPNPSVTTNLIHGIYFAVPGAYVHDNQVNDIVGFCYHGWHWVKEERVEHNQAARCQGIVAGSGDSPCTTDPGRCHTRDISIQYNTLSSTTYGILIEGDPYLTYDYAADHIVVQNNTRDGVACVSPAAATTSERCPK